MTDHENPATEQIITVLQALENETDVDLSVLAFPALKEFLSGSSYAGGSRFQQICDWLSSGFEQICRDAGSGGRDLLKALNTERVRGDLHFAAIVAAALPQVLQSSTITIEQLTALALLIVRAYDAKKGTRSE